jgi:septation ring formation regulator EzrA
MNQVQKNYSLAKSSYEMINVELDRLEQEFMVSHGRKEAHIWNIEAVDDFNKTNDLFARKYGKEHEAYSQLYDNLEKATRELIDFGLSIVPKKYADILRNSQDAAVRNQIIDLIMELDTRTIPVLPVC